VGRPVGDGAILGHHHDVTFTVKHTAWLNGLPVGTHIGDVLSQKVSASLDRDLYSHQPSFSRKHPGSQQLSFRFPYQFSERGINSCLDVQIQQQQCITIAKKGVPNGTPWRRPKLS